MAEALGVAGSIVGVVSLGIQVAQGLLDYYGTWKDQDKEISNMCISLENLLGALVAIRTTIESFGKFDMSIREIVEKNIRTIEQGINELSDELKHALCLGVPKKDLMRSRIRKALYPFKQPTLSKIEQAISQARSNLGISLQTLQFVTLTWISTRRKSTLEVSQNIDKLVRWQEAKTGKYLIGYHRRISGSYRMMCMGKNNPILDNGCSSTQIFLPGRRGRSTLPCGA
ncbi:hypothetical protein CJF30_00003429 [Rutstroemia sp. NJR-2017a BBW]|nr:hypothetical protein CJF30_00003429 [Rutstroemia sp. NJR-2017a BBW]